MSEISVIAGVSPAAIRLLEAAGVRRIDNLARQDAERLFQRLVVINDERSWMGSELTTETVGRWIHNARNVVTGPLRQGQAVAVSGREPGDLTLNLDQVPEVIILEDPKKPPAEAIPPGVADPPKAPREPTPAPATPAIGDLLEVVEDAPPVAVKPTVTASHDPSRHQPAAQEWKEVERERFRNFSAYVENEAGLRPLAKYPGAERDATLPVQRVLTVPPREPSPRRIRRGVPHPRPYFVVLGALIVLLCRLLFLAVLLGTPIALVIAFSPRGDTHLLMNFLWIIGAWLLTCVLYVAVALRVRCRVCTNQIFFSKRCFKNIKAHRVFGLGLVGSLALHALIFGWFRCMYCGTAIRLKFTNKPETLHPRRR